jgi:hypothetical protein
MTDGYCDECENAFENSNVYLELNIETTHMTHTFEFCHVSCLNLWTGKQMDD